MKPTVQALLDSFDHLSDVEQYQVALEILRRAARPATDDVPDEALIATADDLFRELDAREAADAGPSLRSHS
ncbi:MAG: hypothetical protein ACRDJE_08560 [Dehalococcoidia bacterium]